MNTAPPLRPFYARTRFLLLVLVLGIIYTYGWKVTQIQPGKLIRDFHLVKPLISALLQPDLITRGTGSTTTEATFQLTETTGPETAITPPEQPSPTLQLSRTSGQQGDILTVEGFHLRGVPFRGVPREKPASFWSYPRDCPPVVFGRSGTGLFKESTPKGPPRRGPRRSRVRLTFQHIPCCFLAMTALVFRLLRGKPGGARASTGHESPRARDLCKDFREPFNHPL